jgi:hypothetical protein
VTYALQVATSVPRAGRRFEPIRERELHGDALAAAESLPGASRGLVVVPEFSGPIGIPDFTAYVGDVQSLRARQFAPVSPIVNEIDAGVLSVAHVRKPSSADDLAQAIGWPTATVASRLRRLVVAGALFEVAPRRFVRAGELQPSGRLWAIEAKVGDTRSALRQARTYRVWADGYVIVMTDVSVRALEDLRNEVLRDRGGLVLDGRWMVRPRIGRVSATRRLQAAEMFASATRGGL